MNIVLTIIIAFVAFLVGAYCGALYRHRRAQHEQKFIRDFYKSDFYKTGRAETS